MSDNAKRKCKNCAYWVSDNLEPGECRRHAPTAVNYALLAKQLFESCALEDHSDLYVAWPVTLCTEWCGDFAPKTT